MRESCLPRDATAGLRNTETYLVMSSINGANEVRQVPVPMMEDLRFISSHGVTGSNSIFDYDYSDY